MLGKFQEAYELSMSACDLRKVAVLRYVPAAAARSPSPQVTVAGCGRRGDRSRHPTPTLINNYDTCRVRG